MCIFTWTHILNLVVPWYQATDHDVNSQCHMYLLYSIDLYFKVYQHKDTQAFTSAKSDMCFTQFTSLFGKLNGLSSSKTNSAEQEHFWVMIVIFLWLTTWWTFSAHPSVHTSIHLSIPAGALEETKDREDSVLRVGSPPFYLKGRHKPYYLPVTATNYCWLPGSASASTRMNGQTQASLSFYKALLLLPLSFTHSISTCFTPLTSRWPIWHAASRPNSTQGLRSKVGVKI